MKEFERFVPPNWRALSRVAGCAIAIGGTDFVRADVLYDSTDMTDNQTYSDDLTSVIGGAGSFGGGKNFTDSQVCEDFLLTGTFDITSVTGDFFTHPDENAVPEDGILVEFFSDVVGTPAESPFAAVLTSQFTVTHFTDTVFGFNSRDNIARITVDLSAEGITLDPGTWWLSIVPVNVSAGANGFNYSWLRTEFLVSGNITHARDGGIDHGTGMPGIYGPDDWTPVDEIGSNEPGDVSMKIEGTPVKPPCPADFDNSGDVGVKDLLILLGAWGPCPKNGDCPADFDDSGDVGVKDLLILLGVWGSCP